MARLRGKLVQQCDGDGPAPRTTAPAPPKTPRRARARNAGRSGARLEQQRESEVSGVEDESEAASEHDDVNDDYEPQTVIKRGSSADADELLSSLSNLRLKPDERSGSSSSNAIRRSPRKAAPRQRPFWMSNPVDVAQDSSPAASNEDDDGNGNDKDCDDTSKDESELSDFIVDDSASEAELRRPMRSTRKKGGAYDIGGRSQNKNNKEHSNSKISNQGRTSGSSSNNNNNGRPGALSPCKTPRRLVRRLPVKGPSAAQAEEDDTEDEVRVALRPKGAGNVYFGVPELAAVAPSTPPTAFSKGRHQMHMAAALTGASSDKENDNRDSGPRYHLGHKGQENQQQQPQQQKQQRLAGKSVSADSTINLSDQLEGALRFSPPKDVASAVIRNEGDRDEEDHSQEEARLRLSSSSSSSLSAGGGTGEPSQQRRSVYHIRTPPESPSGAKKQQQGRLKSPTRDRRVHIPASPHRQSVDAFWRQDVIDGWNDMHSPKKAPRPAGRLLPFLLSPSKPRQIGRLGARPLIGREPDGQITGLKSDEGEEGDEWPAGEVHGDGDQEEYEQGAQDDHRLGLELEEQEGDEEHDEGYAGQGANRSGSNSSSGSDSSDSGCDSPLDWLSPRQNGESKTPGRKAGRAVAGATRAPPACSGHGSAELTEATPRAATGSTSTTKAGKSARQTDASTAKAKANAKSENASVAAAKREFEADKHCIAADFLRELDDTITRGEIARLSASTGGVRLEWSNKLNSTAGRAKWRRERVRMSQGTSPLRSSSSTAAPDAASNSISTPVSTLTSLSSSKGSHDNLQMGSTATTNTLAPSSSSSSSPKKASADVVTHHHASIELASKVITTRDRLLNVLAHEFCHLANFMVSGVLDQPHGRSFRAWAAAASRAFGGAPYNVAVTTRHSYDIAYRFVWACTTCATEYGRHSRSIDPARHTCSSCRGGALVQIKPAPRRATAAEADAGAGPGTGSTKLLQGGDGGGAGGAAYNAFVKANFALVKAQMEAEAAAKDGTAKPVWGQVMGELARRWREQKRKEKKKKDEGEERGTQDKEEDEGDRNQRTEENGDEDASAMRDRRGFAAKKAAAVGAKRKAAGEASHRTASRDAVLLVTENQGHGDRDDGQQPLDSSDDHLDALTRSLGGLRLRLDPLLPA